MELTKVNGSTPFIHGKGEKAKKDTNRLLGRYCLYHEKESDLKKKFLAWGLKGKLKH